MKEWCLARKLEMRVRVDRMVDRRVDERLEWSRFDFDDRLVFQNFKFGATATIRIS